MSTHLASEWLSGYLDGQVSADERRRVEAHLAGCPVCRETLEDLRRTGAVVRMLDPVTAPAALRPGVRARLTANHSPAVRAGARLWPASWPRPTWRLGLAAAAVLLIGLFSINLFQPMVAVRWAGREENFRRDVPAQTVDATGQAESVVNAQRVGIPVSPPAAQVPGGPRLIFDRHVIRSADLQLEVANFDAAADDLVRIAEDAGGFVADTAVTQQEPPAGTFVLRVPAVRFTAVLDRVEALGRVTDRRVSGQDITEEFVDLQARIRNLQTHERQLLTFMGRATRVSDLLAIEQELSRVRGEIEQLTGRARFLANRVELATVRVALREKAKPGGSIFWDFTASVQRIRTAFLGTIRQLLGAAEQLVVLLSALVPLALLVVLGWGALRWLLRRRANAV